MSLATKLFEAPRPSSLLWKCEIMIASFSRNFIFVKTRKTAGTSLEIVLSSWCGGKDICTTISGEDEILRRAYGSAPLNFSDAEGEAKFWKALDRGDLTEVEEVRRLHKSNGTFFNHMPASQIKEILPDLWKSAFKFTVERHPYDRMVSLVYWQAYWRTRSKITQLDFEKEFDITIGNKILPNYPLYMDGDNLLVDQIFNYETMWIEVEKLRRQWGAPPMHALPKAKAGLRKTHLPAHELLSSEQKRKIIEVTMPEFELMGWEY